jgi:hypothetical protein
MTGKERINAALAFRDFDRIPIERDDCTSVPFEYPGWFRGGGPGKAGNYLDGWGCRWEVLEPGVCGEVKGHPLGDDWKGLETFRPPYGILEKADLSKVEQACEEQKDTFITVQWEPPMNVPEVNKEAEFDEWNKISNELKMGEPNETG